VHVKNGATSGGAHLAGHYAFNRSYITDGLNRYSDSGPAELSYDGRGNLSQSSVTGLPTLNFTYTSQKSPVGGPSSSLIVYDPFGRFLQVYHADSGGAHYQRFDSRGASRRTGIAFATTAMAARAVSMRVLRQAQDDRTPRHAR